MTYLLDKLNQVPESWAKLKIFPFMAVMSHMIQKEYKKTLHIYSVGKVRHIE